MYDTLSDFLRTFSVDYPLPWAFLVMGVVACTSLALYVFWEFALRLLSPRNSPSYSQRRKSE
jgi:hypothetical protein